VHLVCLNGPTKPEIPEGLLESIEVVQPHAPTRWERYSRMIRGVVSGIPPVAARSSSKAMAARADILLSGHDFDAILLFELSAIQYCPRHALARTVANVEDPPSLRFAGMFRLPVFSLMRRAVLALDAALCWRYERQIFSRIGKVLVLSEYDAIRLRKLHPRANISAVPYGVRCAPEHELTAYGARQRDMIVISGNMFHPPNVEGVLSFLREGLPKVLSQIPGATLYLVGDRPDRRIHHAASKFGERVVITGRVLNVSDYLRKAVVSVCPVHLAIGVQTKILEALAWGTPVVTTVEGNSGIAGQSGTHLWAESTADKLSMRVVELLRGQNWASLSREGRAHVRTSFNWDTSATLLEKHAASVRRVPS
jgi:glycosyltransferase involved in cell wall biosynthesis